jgi:hypothetical protein
LEVPDEACLRVSAHAVLRLQEEKNLAPTICAMVHTVEWEAVMALEFTTSFVEDARAIFRYYRRLGEGAMAQTGDAHLFATLDPEMNSIAQIVKHMAGNMRSRWTGFPQADGEKPDRNRDAEFEDPPATRAAVLALWDEGWDCLFRALEPLREEDMSGVTTIRGERHSVMQAIQRQVAHYSYHVGQIVVLAKHFQGANWQSLSVPRGHSSGFNQAVREGRSSQR